MMCGQCKYWVKKSRKDKSFAFGLVHLTSVLGICNNPAAMDLINLIPNENAFNIIPHATIETDETFGCIYFEPVDLEQFIQRSTD